MARLTYRDTSVWTPRWRDTLRLFARLVRIRRKYGV